MNTRNIFHHTIIGLTAIMLSYNFYENIKPLSKREKYSLFLKEHPFNNRPHEEIYENEEQEESETDRPDLAWEQDYLRTMNPDLGRPTPENLSQIISMMNSDAIAPVVPGSAAIPWIERGPNNVGGRTISLAWDPNDITQKKVWAGSVTGGLWYNNDITSSTSGWNAVNDFWANIAISCIAFDPINSQIAYVGTGEGFGAAAGRGAGIWKTTDAGNSWSQITSTANFSYVNDIVVRNESGASVIYAAVDGGYYGGIWNGVASAGLRRSTNGGSTWTQVLPNVTGQSSNYVAADIEISANNRLWIGTKSNSFGHGGGAVLYSDNGTSWITSNTTTVATSKGRVEIACSPSNANVVYAMVENNNAVSVLKKTTNGGANWGNISTPVDADTGIPGSDFSRGQAWYDLVMSVDPSNENTLIVGAVDLFITYDGGSAWSQISKWSNNNNLANLSCPFVHADQHAILYKPGSSSSVIFGTDGGVFYSSNITLAATTSNAITSRNKNFNVTQFYACAQHPTAGTNYFLAGAQDNGTQKFTSIGLNATTQASGGDGAFCFIDQNNPNYQISSYVYNRYYISTNAGADFSNTILNDNSTGEFINIADYDDNLHILYSYKSSGAIYRVKNVTTSPVSETVTISPLNSAASAMTVSPYSASSSTLFIGTDAGKLLKVTNANSTSSTTDIGSTSFPTGSISCIEIGASEMELVVTFFNYGVTSVWYTSNGGSTWVSKEGDLPDMPVRWALFNPDNRFEMILATELGVWGTTNFNTSTPNWTASNSGLANVRVDMLQMRKSDKQIVAATHGRGLFTSSGFVNNLPPLVGFSASNVMPCSNQVVTLTDTSLYNPTTWTWSISPSSFTFVNGTNANSKNPQVQFTAVASYTVTLQTSNSYGINQLVKTDYITVGGLNLPFTENWENPSTYSKWVIDNPDNGVTWSIYNTSGTSPGNNSAGVANYDYSDAQYAILRDGLISPQIKLNGYNTALLNFQHAYRRLSDTEQDSMAVYISLNCSGTWTRIGSYRETKLVAPFDYITVSDNSVRFIPAVITDWCGNANYGKCNSINLTPYVGNLIQLKFENISAYGNNLYIDNISVTGTSNTPPPVADFTASATSGCSANSIKFTDKSTGNPTYWNWTFTPNTIQYVNGTSSLSQNPEVTFNAGGTYSVQLSAGNAGGTNAKTLSPSLTITNSVITTISISSTDTIICSGKNVAFSTAIKNGGSTPLYAWSLNGTKVGSSSTYSNNNLKDRDTVKCELTSNATCALPSIKASNSIIMNVNATPTVTLTLNQKQSCVSDPTFAIAGGIPVGGVYSGKGVSASNFNPSVAGFGTIPIYYKYTNAKGCADSSLDNITVANTPPIPIITQSGDILSCNQSGYSYKWFKDGSEISGANQQTFQIVSSGNYQVEIGSFGTCTKMSLSVTAFKVGLSELNGMNGFTLYPNPSKDIFNIEFIFNKPKQLLLEVFDVNGKQVFNDLINTEKGNNLSSINLEHLGIGNYILKISNGNKFMTRTLVIQ